MRCDLQRTRRAEGDVFGGDAERLAHLLDGRVVSEFAEALQAVAALLGASLVHLKELGHAAVVNRNVFVDLAVDLFDARQRNREDAALDELHARNALVVQVLLQRRRGALDGGEFRAVDDPLADAEQVLVGVHGHLISGHLAGDAERAHRNAQENGLVERIRPDLRFGRNVLRLRLEIRHDLTPVMVV